MSSIVSIQNLNKQYTGGFQALSDINLNINKGEIFALLGPNGAGKTTLISIICGLKNITGGKVSVNNFDTIKNYKSARKLIGLVPQELTTDMFETVWDTVNFSRGLFGLAPNSAYIEDLLKKLTLWDKKDNKLMELSGGMKRRVMIAKALSHEPQVLFLDEPTAGVDVKLRKDMWQQIHILRQSGVTIILTTHYIEEAEEMADRIGVINNGKLVLIEEKETLMTKLGKKHIHFELAQEIDTLPDTLLQHHFEKIDALNIRYNYENKTADVCVSDIIDLLKQEKITYKDIHTRQSTLEEIFVELLKES